MSFSAENNREYLQVKSPELKDVVIRTSKFGKRTLPGDIKLIDLGIFAEEADKLRKMISPSGPQASQIAVVDHINTKFLLSDIRHAKGDTPAVFDLKIHIYEQFMNEERDLRQDKSVGLLITTLTDQHDAIKAVAQLLIEEKDISSPTGAMIITSEGMHLFFRSQHTIEQTREENKNLIKLNRANIKDFAKFNQLRHFYCPVGKTIATPVMM